MAGRSGRGSCGCHTEASKAAETVANRKEIEAAREVAARVAAERAVTAVRAGAALETARNRK